MTVGYSRLIVTLSTRVDEWEDDGHQPTTKNVKIYMVAMITCGTWEVNMGLIEMDFQSIVIGYMVGVALMSRYVTRCMETTMNKEQKRILKYSPSL